MSSSIEYLKVRKLRMENRWYLKLTSLAYSSFLLRVEFEKAQLFVIGN